MRTLLLAFFLIAAAAAQVLAQAKKPRVPPGRDPGGTTIALISSGVDYTQGFVAEKLARDGEGEIVGWDFIDNDMRPFDRQRGAASAAAGGDGTALAGLIATDNLPARIVVLRADVASARTLGNAVMFAAKTGARIVVMPMWSANGDAWETFRQAVAYHRDVLFILAAGEGADPAALYPAAFNFENMMVVASAAAPREALGFGGARKVVAGGALAAATSARAAAAILARQPKLDIVRLKKSIEAETGAGR